MSRSSTPAPFDHDDDGTDDEDEQPPSAAQPKPVAADQVAPNESAQPFKPLFPRAASASHLPLDSQFRAAAVAAANAAAAIEPQLSDANDDEVSQITLGKVTESKPVAPPAGETKKLDDKVNFGLPDHGAFSDAHDGQRQQAYSDRKSSISTQNDFSLPDVLKQSMVAGNTASFVPTSGESIVDSTEKADDLVTKL